VDAFLSSVGDGIEMVSWVFCLVNDGGVWVWVVDRMPVTSAGGCGSKCACRLVGA
jgi:hypothetical protein